MSTEKNPEFRYGIPSELQDGWKVLRQRTGMPQSQILDRLVGFVLGQDPLAQAMVLGQVSPSDDLVETLIKRLKNQGDDESGPAPIPITRPPPPSDPRLRRGNDPMADPDQRQVAKHSDPARKRVEEKKRGK